MRSVRRDGPEGSRPGRGGGGETRKSDSLRWERRRETGWETGRQRAHKIAKRAAGLHRSPDSGAGPHTRPCEVRACGEHGGAAGALVRPARRRRGQRAQPTYLRTRRPIPEVCSRTRLARRERENTRSAAWSAGARAVRPGPCWSHAAATHHQPPSGRPSPARRPRPEAVHNDPGSD